MLESDIVESEVKRAVKRAKIKALRLKTKKNTFAVS